MKGWIGVDLDGTLAHYDGWVGPGHIGYPVPAMLDRVREWLEDGKDVRIFTARVSKGDHSPQRVYEAGVAIYAIQQWCAKYVGRILPITNIKDELMVELWDDRCVQVIPNTGARADSQESWRNLGERTVGNGGGV